MGISSEQLQRLIDAEAAGVGGGASTTADGADVAQGALADAVVAAGASGSLSAKLRRLTTDLGALLTLLPSSLGAKTAAASLSVVQASDQVGPGVDVVASGTLGALNNAVTISTKGLASVVAEIDAGLTGTATYEVTNDDGAWTALAGLAVSTALTPWQNTDATSFPTRRIFSVGGFSQFRIRCSAYTSGSAAARVRGSVAPHIARVGPGMAAAAAAADGTSNTLALVYDPAGGGRLLGIAPHVYQGASWDRQYGPNIFKVQALGAATAETTIWTPAGGKKFRLMGLLLTPGASSTLTFKDNTAGTTIFSARGVTDTPISATFGNGILSAAANNPLTITRGTSATLDGVVWGVEV